MLLSTMKSVCRSAGVLLLLALHPAEGQFKAPDSLRNLVSTGMPQQNSGYVPQPMQPPPGMQAPLQPQGFAPYNQQRIAQLFEAIMAQMTRFETMKEPFVLLMQNPPTNPDTRTRRILSGQESEGLNSEFMRLREKADTILANGDLKALSEKETDFYKDELEAFYASLEAHVSEVHAVIEENESRLTRGAGSTVMSAMKQAFSENNATPSAYGRALPPAQTPQVQNSMPQQQAPGNSKFASAYGNSNSSNNMNTGNSGVYVSQQGQPESTTTTTTTAAGGFFSSWFGGGASNNSAPAPVQEQNNQRNSMNNNQVGGQPTPSSTNDLINKLQNKPASTHHINMTPKPLDGPGGYAQNTQQQAGGIQMPPGTGAASGNLSNLTAGGASNSNRLTQNQGVGVGIPISLGGPNSEAQSKLQQMLGDKIPMANTSGGQGGALFPSQNTNVASNPLVDQLKNGQAQMMAGGPAATMGAGVPQQPPVDPSQDPVAFHFQQMQQQMQLFERDIQPLFQQLAYLPPERANGLTPQEKQVLEGVVSEGLHRQFLGIQESAQQVARVQEQVAAQGGNLPQDQQMQFQQMLEQFLATVEQYNRDVTAHIAECRTVFGKVGLTPGTRLNPGGNAPISPMMQGGGAGSNTMAMPPTNMPTPAGMGGGMATPSGMGGAAMATPANAVEAVFQQIQVEMQNFEQVAPQLFSQSQVLQQLLQQPQISPQERAILTGEMSQALHERFLTLQQKAVNGGNEIVNDQTYLQELQEFAGQLKQHVGDVTTLAAAVRNAAGGTLSPPAAGGSGPMGAATGAVGGVGMSAPIQIDRSGAPNNTAPNNAASSGGIDLSKLGGHIPSKPSGDVPLAQPPNLAAMGIGQQGGMPSMPGMGGPGAGMPAAPGMATPAGFGGAAAAGTKKSDPISDKINALLESVQKTMDKFETDIKPLFKQVPPPQALQGKLEGEELQIATGQASEALHRRYQSIEQRLNGLARTANPGPGIVEAFIQDLTAYEKDIKDHVEKAQDVMKRAAKMSVGSSEAYQKQGNIQKILTIPEMEEEMKKMALDLEEGKKKLPKSLRHLQKRIKKELPKLADPNLPKIEADKMAHVMSTLMNGALEGIKRIRNGFDKKSIEELNEIFWNDMGMDYQRFQATMRDLDKETLESRRKSAKSTKDISKNIQMPGMKLQGVLGTSGVNKANMDSRGKTDFVGDSQRKAASSTAAQMGGGIGGGMGAPMLSPTATRPSGLQSLPKLEIGKLDL